MDAGIVQQRAEVRVVVDERYDGQPLPAFVVVAAVFLQQSVEGLFYLTDPVVQQPGKVQKPEGIHEFLLV